MRRDAEKRTHSIKDVVGDWGLSGEETLDIRVKHTPERYLTRGPWGRTPTAAGS